MPARETAYRRALDVLMSAVDEYQIQAAIFRLRRAQARLHGWGMSGSHDPERRGYLGPEPVAPLQLFGICLKLQDFEANGARSPRRQ